MFCRQHVFQPFFVLATVITLGGAAAELSGYSLRDIFSVQEYSSTVDPIKGVSDGDTGDAEIRDIKYVVIKSTVGENSRVGERIKKLLNSKRIQVSGPEKERAIQKASKYNNEVEIFYEQDWNDAEKLINIVNEKLGYKLAPKPDFNNESNVRKDLVIVWLKHGT